MRAAFLLVLCQHPCPALTYPAVNSLLELFSNKQIQDSGIHAYFFSSLSLAMKPSD